jgi:hypothetical protein
MCRPLNSTGVKVVKWDLILLNIDGVLIDDLIYWALTGRNYK